MVSKRPSVDRPYIYIFVGYIELPVFVIIVKNIKVLTTKDRRRKKTVVSSSKLISTIEEKKKEQLHVNSRLQSM